MPPDSLGGHPGAPFSLRLRNKHPTARRCRCLQEHPLVARVKAKARADVQAKRAARPGPIQHWIDRNRAERRGRKTPARPSAPQPAASGQVVEQQAGPAIQEIDESDEDDDSAGNTESDQKEVREGHSP
eukprot:5356638-Prymnesium_polylepis.1